LYTVELNEVRVAMTALGYSLERGQFYVKNSYGTEWGLAGYCWIPVEYIEKYGFEHWNVALSGRFW
jgi:C1A family cysteine protease